MHGAAVPTSGRTLEPDTSRSAKNFDRSSTISRGERVCTGRQLGENEPALASVAYKAQVEMFND